MNTLVSPIFKFFKSEKILLAILIIGFLLRLIGIFWGVPFPDPLEGTYHPDEPKIITGAVKFPFHILNNENLYYPTFFPYFLATITLPLRLPFYIFNLSDSSFYYVITVIGRMCSVLAGTGAILITYFFAKDIYDRKRALLACIFLTFSLYHAQNSSLATTDVLSSFFLVAFLFLLRLAFLNPVRTWPFIIVGVTLGLLVGTKYTAAIATIPIFVMYVYSVFVKLHSHKNDEEFRLGTLHINLLLCGVVALATFLMTTPGIVFRFNSFIESMQFVLMDLKRFETPRSDPNTWKGVFYTLKMSIGFPLSDLFLFGLFFPYKKNIYEISFVVLLLAFFLYFGNRLVPRYVILITPLIAMIASNGSLWLYELNGKPFKFLGGMIISVAILYSAAYCLFNIYWRYDDTRTQANNYIENFLPAGATLGIAYTSEDFSWEYHPWKYPRISFNKFIYEDFLNYPEFLVTSSFDLWQIEQALKSDKISNDYNWDKRYDKEWYQYSPPSPRIFQFYDELLDPERSRYNLLKTFKKSWDLPLLSHTAEFASPEIRVYIRRFNIPNTASKTYYPDNPRDYFKKEDIRQTSWSLDVQGKNIANLVLPVSNPDALRIDISKAETKIPWHIRLNYPVRSNSPKAWLSELPWNFRFNHPRLLLQSNRHYVLMFKARADSPRHILVGVRKEHEKLGLFKDILLTSEWQSFQLEFVAKTDYDNARIHFDTGGSNFSVDLSDVKLISLPGLQPVDSDPYRHFVSYRFNSIGCRGKDYSMPRPNDTVRILVLGDSYTMGVGVHEEDTFANQLEKLLSNNATKQDSKTSYQVINCGVNGFGTRDERSFYESSLSKYDPDIVLLVIGPDDVLSWSNLKNMRYNSASRNMNHRSPFLKRNYDDSYQKNHENSFSDGMEEILKLNSSIQESGAKLSVVIFRNTTDSSWDELADEIGKGLKESNIPVLDLGETFFRNNSHEELIVHKTDHHPNEIAHRIAAREIYTFLEDQSLISDR